MTDTTPTPITSRQWEAVLRAALGPPTIEPLSCSLASSLVAHNESILKLSVVLSRLTARVEALEAQQAQPSQPSQPAPAEDSESVPVVPSWLGWWSGPEKEAGR